MPINERRAALGLPTNAFLVGLFGRFTAWKGQHVALDAIARVPDAHFVLVGDALFDETDYAQSLRAQARAPGIEERVHFAGFQHGVASWMNTMDVVEHASTQSKPLGLVIVESMAACKPVIASNDGTAPAPKADVDVTLAKHRQPKCQGKDRNRRNEKLNESVKD